MKKEKSSLQKISNGFITATVITVSAILVSSGIAISKVNTEYMSTGIRAEKIVAVRDSEEIFITIGDTKLLQGTEINDKIDKILSFSPAPINTIYIAIKELTRQ